MATYNKRGYKAPKPEAEKTDNLDNVADLEKNISVEEKDSTTASVFNTLDETANKTEEFIFDTIEFDPLVANDTQERFDKLNIPIKVLSGEAMEVISKLETNYDLVFFDAQKSHYFKQLNLLIERGLIGKNTLLLADNVIDRQDECADFLNWFKSNKINHTIIPTECGLLVATL